MVTEFVIDLIYKIVSGLLTLLPDFSWDVESSVFSYFIGILQAAGYMLPMDTVGIIVGLIVALTTFRIVISIIKTIWDLLPIV